MQALSNFPPMSGIKSSIPRESHRLYSCLNYLLIVLFSNSTTLLASLKKRKGVPFSVVDVFDIGNCL